MNASISCSPRSARSNRFRSSAAPSCAEACSTRHPPLFGVGRAELRERPPCTPLGSPKRGRSDIHFVGRCGGPTTVRAPYRTRHHTSLPHRACCHTPEKDAPLPAGEGLRMVGDGLSGSSGTLCRSRKCIAPPAPLALPPGGEILRKEQATHSVAALRGFHTPEKRGHVAQVGGEGDPLGQGSEDQATPPGTRHPGVEDGDHTGVGRGADQTARALLQRNLNRGYRYVRKPGSSSAFGELRQLLDQRVGRHGKRGL